MITFIITFIFLLLIVTGMSLGVIFNNKPITSSCGGLNTILKKNNCIICNNLKQKKICNKN